MGSIKIGILGLSRVLFYFFLRLSNKRRKWKACAFVFVWPDGRWERRCRCVDKALLVLCCLTPLLFAEATLGFSGVLATAFEGAQPIPPPLPSSLFWGWRICSQPWVHISIWCLHGAELQGMMFLPTPKWDPKEEELLLLPIAIQSPWLGNWLACREGC